MWRVRGLSRISLSYNVLPLFSADASIYVSFSPSYFTGEYLANAGINPNLSKIYDSAVFVLEAQ